MTQTLRTALLPICVAVMILTLLGCSDTPGSPHDQAAKTVTVTPPPTLEILNTTDTSITVRITAPNVGAPEGFILQWAPAALLNQAGGWENYPACAAIFGQLGPFGVSAFHLAPNQQMVITIGHWVTAAGLSAQIDPDCADFHCGDNWSIRASIVPFGICEISEYTPTATATIAIIPGCESGQNHCTFSQGYWKNHQGEWPAPYSPAAAFYSSGRTWAQTISDPGSGDKQLRVQYIAALLNKANGSPTSQIVAVVGVGNMSIQDILDESNTYFTQLPATTLNASRITEYASVLEAWNTHDFYPDEYSGYRIGPGHCDGEQDPDGGGESETCTYSQGYWKNHQQLWPAPYDPGNMFFSSSTTWGQTIADPGNGDKQLRVQYIAAVLNQQTGAPVNEIVDISGVGNKSIAQILVETKFHFEHLPATTLTEAQITEYAIVLEAWNTHDFYPDSNTGVRLGPGHCE